MRTHEFGVGGDILDSWVRVSDWGVIFGMKIGACSIAMVMRGGEREGGGRTGTGDEPLSVAPRADGGLSPSSSPP